MEKKTYAEIVVELEKAVRPLGFKIKESCLENVGHPYAKTTYESDADKELRITIIRIGKLAE